MTLAAFASGDPAPAAASLTLERAVALALDRQPLLEAQRARVAAARERAVAAAQLPDPMLTAGVTNLPVNTDDRFSLSRDFMTMTGVGLMQEFPRAEKRRLRGRAETLDAEAGEARLAALERAIRRDTALGYLDAWLPERAVVLAQAMADEAERERMAAEIAFRAGRAPQADVFAADVELELLRDRIHKLEQDAAEAHERLSRWVGEAAATSLAKDPPQLSPPPELPALQAGIERHPELATAAAEIQAAENSLALTQQAYKPDWRVETMLAHRPDFSEMLTVQFGIDLPVFTANRQDRETAAAVQQLDASEASRDDLIRQMRAMAGSAHRAWSEASSRLARYDELIVPRAQQRAEAALAAYRAGNTELAAVLDARRAAFDVLLMRLELEVEILRRLTELHYLNVEGA